MIFFYKYKCFSFIILLLLSVLILHAENINDDFELSAKVGENPPAVFITIAPKPDKKIKGMSPRKPFITLSAEGIIFDNNGILIRTEYITESKPEVLSFPFHPARENMDLTRIELHLEMTYVPCLISTGVCKFPETIERDFLLTAAQPGISPAIINSGVLITLLICAIISLILYIIRKKDFLFLSLFILICSDILFYTFIQADENGLSQANLSLSIARTLCLSCIGIESARDVIPIDRSKTEIYSRLKEPVLVTVFSAPWCGSCPAAKAYVKELSMIYNDTLSYEVIDISNPAGKEKYDEYRKVYSFEEPLPLPAIIVSTNTTDVLYGTYGIEDNLIELITKGAEISDE